MRLTSVFLSILTFATLATFLLAAAVYLPSAAQAGTTIPAAKTPAPAGNKRDKEALSPWPKPKVAFARPRLNLDDEIGTLKAIQHALSEVGDGSTFVWHRANGRLSGLFKPTMSFRDGKGQICRHIEIWLTTGSRTKKTESIACRQRDRVWAFEG